LQDLENQNPNERPGLPQEALTSPVAVGMYFILALGLVAFGAYSFVQWRWRRYLRTLKPGAQASAEMYRFAPFAGFRERRDATADERAQELANLLPDSHAPIGEVNDAYVGERYGGLDLNDEQATAARATGIAVQKRTWRAVYQRHVGSKLTAAREYLKDAGKVSKS
jgi:hypothetical protein